MSIAQAKNTEVKQAEVQLQHLQKRMTRLEETLHQVKDKREMLNLEIAKTETEIGETIRQLSMIEQNIKEKHRQIQTLKQLIETLNHQMTMQHSLLAKHLRARYKMGENQPFKWLLNQENPYAISRLLTYYQYVVKSRQTIVHQVLETQMHLNQNQEKLHQETQQQQFLENQVKQRQQHLNESKHYHTALILNLEKDIQNKQQTMAAYEYNKQKLTEILQSLAQQGLSTRHFPLMQMRHHLLKPVQTTPAQIQPTNQGLAFFADEGTTVSAVASGKVVFSDWLNGYGLLLIIDHGAGYMTLYAHNQSLFKQKGTYVEKGDKIATVGHTGGLKKNGLYFEVRHGGKAIPPLEWLS
jgi:septal ring factor EnvC (AmiA/AmiB activator)